MRVDLPLNSIKGKKILFQSCVSEIYVVNTPKKIYNFIFKI